METPCGVVADLWVYGVLRLRECFASRGTLSAQDDGVVEPRENLIFAFTSKNAARSSYDASVVIETPCGAAADLWVCGVLRLRECFASRGTLSAQDDRVVEPRENLIFGCTSKGMARSSYDASVVIETPCGAAADLWAYRVLRLRSG